MEILELAEHLLQACSSDQSHQACVAELSKLLDDYVLKDLISIDALVDKVVELQKIVTEKKEDEPESWNDVMNFILDVVWLKDLEYQQLPEPEQRAEYQGRLVAFVKQLLRLDLVSEQKIKEKMETEFIDALKIYFYTPEGPILFSSKTKRIYTSHFCKQQKFNRTAEESEGYAKLMLEVHRCRVQGSVSDDHISSVIANIDSVVGYFMLDPTRVIDIVMDLFAFGVCGYVEYYMKIINRLYVDAMPSKQECQRRLSALLGWKFDYHRRKAAELPKGYYIITALFVKHGLIELSQILAYLSPADLESIDKEYTELADVRQKEAKSSSSHPVLSGLLEGIDGGLDSKKASEDASETTPTTVKTVNIENHKVCLCAALFAVGEIGKGMEMLSGNPKFAYLNYSIVHEVVRALEYMIDPVYQSVVNVKKDTSSINHIPKITLHQYYPEFSKYYREWSSSIELIENIEDVLDKIVPFLAVIGPRLAFNISLATRITRLGAHIVKQTTEAVTKKLWLDIVSSYLFPTLSLSDGNSGFAAEIWELVKLFPFKTRYTLYGEWKNSTYEKYPELSVVKMVTISDTKKLLRRIATENIKQSGRKLCKLSCSNPLVCFPTLIEQIQVYDSLIAPLSDALRYMTNLGFDIMSYCLINAMADTKKDRLKADGTHISMWLNSLAVFTAHMFQRHKAMELNGILEYIYFQGLSGNALDLIVMKELVTKMSGIEQMIEGFSEEQIQCMSGGNTLKLQALKGKPMDEATKQTARRLAKALIDTELADKFLVLIAQQQQSCVYKSDIPHLKLLGSLFDQVQETLIQYVDFVGSHLENSEYTTICPSLDSMKVKFGIDDANSWFIFRKKRKLLEDHTMETSQDINLQVSLAEKTISILSREFYETFWSLDLYDIQVPHDRYLVEIGKLQKLIDENVEESTSTSRRGHDKYEGAKIDRSQQKEQYSKIAERLKEEHQTQSQNRDQIIENLKNSRDWFLNSSNRDEIIDQLMQFCFSPRFLFSANDAVFSAKFVFLMHSLGIYNFSIIDMLAKIVLDVSKIVPICSQNEASNYGRFLREVFEQTEQWRSNETVYNEKAKGGDNLLPGCLIEFSNAPEDETIDKDLWQHTEFCGQLMYGWHLFLYRSFADCLESKEYMKMRNSIVILDKISEYFPKLALVGTKLMSKVKRLLQEETREDMKVLLTRYNAVLQHNQTKWISEKEFRGDKPDSEETNIEHEHGFGIVELQSLSEPVSPSADAVQSPSQFKDTLGTPMKGERDANDTEGWQALPKVDQPVSEDGSELQEEKQALLKKLTEDKMKKQEQSASTGNEKKSDEIQKASGGVKRRSETDNQRRSERDNRSHPYKRNSNSNDDYQDKRPRYEQRPSSQDYRREPQDYRRDDRSRDSRRDGEQRRYERRDERREDRPTRNRR